MNADMEVKRFAGRVAKKNKKNKKNDTTAAVKAAILPNGRIRLVSPRPNGAVWVDVPDSAAVQDAARDLAVGNGSFVWEPTNPDPGWKRFSTGPGLLDFIQLKSFGPVENLEDLAAK